MRARLRSISMASGSQAPRISCSTVGSTLYFQHAGQPWQSDGTEPGTGEVRSSRGDIDVPSGVPVVPLSLVGVKCVARGGLRVHAGSVQLVVHAAIPTAASKVL